MDAKTTLAINDEIQKVVLSRLADVNLTARGRERGVIAFRPKPDWYGLIAQVISQREIRQIEEVANTIERFG